jgi:hypothetical protein
LFYVIPAAYFLNKESSEGKEEGKVLIPSLSLLSLFSPFSLFYIIPAAYFLNKESREGKEGEGRL